jgi:hypothetical protein
MNLLIFSRSWSLRLMAIVSSSWFNVPEDQLSWLRGVVVCLSHPPFVIVANSKTIPPPFASFRIGHSQTILPFDAAITYVVEKGSLNKRRTNQKERHYILFRSVLLTSDQTFIPLLKVVLQCYKTLLHGWHSDNVSDLHLGIIQFESRKDWQVYHSFIRILQINVGMVP